MVFAGLFGLAISIALPVSGFGQTRGGLHVKSLDYAALSLRNRSSDSHSENLLSNPDFEHGTDGWSVQAWAKKGRANVDSEERHGNHPSLRIHNAGADNTFVSQKVSIKPSTHYRLSCWVKTRDIVVKQGRGNAGATLWIAGGWEATKFVKDAENWARVELDFDSGKRTEIQVGPRLGQWGGILTGTAWFSDVSLVEL
jgi:hypothetical protein